MQVTIAIFGSGRPPSFGSYRFANCYVGLHGLIHKAHRCLPFEHPVNEATFRSFENGLASPDHKTGARRAIYWTMVSPILRYRVRPTAAVRAGDHAAAHSDFVAPFSRVLSEFL